MFDKLHLHLHVYHVFEAYRKLTETEERMRHLTLTIRRYLLMFLNDVSISPVLLLHKQKHTTKFQTTLSVAIGGCRKAK